MSVLVPDDGHKHAKLVIIGEAPSHHEVARRQPFVGPSGLRLAEWMRAVRLDRSDAYWTNVYPYQAPKNRIELVPKNELAHWSGELHARIAALTDPIVLVPTGNTALRALTGHASIMKHRGSIYAYHDRNGRPLKVIPTIHPAATFRTPGWERRCRRDWERIADDLTFRDLRLSEREHFISPTLGDLYDYLDDAIKRADVLAVDIETPRSREIQFIATKKGGSRKKIVKGPRRTTVVGFAHEPSFSMTIPTTLEYWRDPETLAEVWSIIRALLALPCEKAFHNGYAFDAWWLKDEHDIDIRRARWDTLCMAHAHDPVDSHSLAYLASVDTREPYWKCLFGSTEILTPSGWQALESCGSNPMAMVYDRGSLRWEQTEHVALSDFNGTGIRIRSLRHDTWYTSNHRIVTRGKFADNERIAEIVDCPMVNSLVTAGSFEGGSSSIPAIRLLVAIQADANVRRGIVSFNLTRHRKISRLRHLCESLDVQLRGAVHPIRKRLECRIKGYAVDEAIYRLGSNKQFGPWLLELNRECLEAFLDEIVYWDGWTTYNGKAINYASKHRTNVEWVATIAHLLGRTAYIQPINSGQYWKVSVKDRDCIAIRPHHWNYEPFIGIVHCLTTTTGAFLARSNGHIFVTGNSDGKEDDKDVDEAFDIDTYWRYNGKDACVTRELVDVHHQRLTKAGLLDFYKRNYVDLFGPLLRLGRHGLSVDDRRRALRRARLRSNLIDCWDKLADAAGERLEAKRELSGKKLAAYLYGTLGLPKQVDRKTKAVTTKEIVVRRLMLRFPAKLATAGSLILDARRTRKLSEFLDEGVLDADKRVRCVYKLSPETGRLASAKNPRRTGRNLQNIDREIRNVYIPDSGCLFIEADLSQAESRVVNMLTGHPELIKLARMRPTDFDDHRRTASIIFNKPTDAIDKTERYFGKKTRHASNYGMRGQNMSDELLKEGVVRDADECDAWIDRLLARDKPILDWHRATRALIMREHRLVDSWGGVWDVRYERLGDDLYRRAYARIPQGEVARLLNQWGLIPLDRAIQKGLPARINAQCHDSLLNSCSTAKVAYQTMTLLRDSLERPRAYWSPVTKETNDLTIPVGFRLGSTWACEIEFRSFPTFDEFKAAWATLEPKIRP